MTIPHPCELDDPIYMPSTHGSIRGALSGMRACFFDRILVTKKLRVKKKAKDHYPYKRGKCQTSYVPKKISFVQDPTISC